MDGVTKTSIFENGVNDNYLIERLEWIEGHLPRRALELILPCGVTSSRLGGGTIDL